MASTAQRVPAANPPFDTVANAFVAQYYSFCLCNPELVHRFYKDISKVGRPGDNGVTSTATTMDEINKKMLDFGMFSAKIISTDAQESHNGGIFVVVTGFLTRNKENLGKKFTQSFFLAEQENGYFVLNDVLKYVDESTPENCLHGYENNGEKSVASVEGPRALQDNHVSEPVIAVSKDVGEQKVRKPSENGEVSIKEEAPAPEVGDESPDGSKEAAESENISWVLV